MDPLQVVIRIEEPVEPTPQYLLLYRRLVAAMRSVFTCANTTTNKAVTGTTCIQKAVVYHPELSDAADCNNGVRTSKYTIVSFIPKNLWYQLHLFANVYFLCAAGLQMIPAVSDSGGRPLLLIPLLFVITVSAFRDAIEDMKRHNNDKQENKRTVRRLVAKRRQRSDDGTIYDRSSTSLVDRVHWDELRVGDVVKIGIGEQFPADLVLLTCDDTGGMIFVETMNLDGETNLKPKICIPTLQNAFYESSNTATIEENIIIGLHEAELHYETPNSQLYKFQGQLLLNTMPDHDTTDYEESSSEHDGRGGCGRHAVSSLPLSIDQLLLRGTSLQSCNSGHHCYGVVVYPGMDTRIYRNSMETGRLLLILTLVMGKEWDIRYGKE